MYYLNQQIYEKQIMIAQIRNRPAKKPDFNNDTRSQNLAPPHLGYYTKEIRVISICHLFITEDRRNPDISLSFTYWESALDIVKD